MADPARIDIVVDRRVPYTETFAFLDLDFSGSGYAAHVRSTKDTTGVPFGDISTGVSLLFSGSETVALHITAGHLTDEIYTLVNPATGDLYASSDTVQLSQIKIHIIDCSGFPFPDELSEGERGDDWVGWYDVIRSPASGDDELIMAGTFTVRAGVTIP